MSNRPPALKGLTDMIDLALVGAAHIHTPGFIKRIQNRRDVRITKVWDHDAERAKKNADALNAEVVDDAGAIWRDDGIAAVVICSETNRHEPLVFSAAESGKSMFVEKPLGFGATDARRMAGAIEQAGVTFQTGYFMRGAPIHRFLREHIRQGSFGQVTRIRHSNCHGGALGGWFDADWRWMADVQQAGCGAFGDLGTHSLDILIWLMGGVKRVAAKIDVAVARYPDCDEFGEALIEFDSGAVGTLAAGWVDVANPVACEVCGTEGHALVVSGELHVQSPKIAGAEEKLTKWEQLPEPWPHAFEIFLDTVAKQSGPPCVTPDEAAYRSEVMAAMYEASSAGTWLSVG